MKILSKNGNELLLLAMKEDSAAKGDYLLIEDRSRSMIVQVYDEEYLSSQALIEDIVKEEVVNASSIENIHDPLNIGSLSRLVRDARVFRAKIRASVNGGKLSSDVGWLPSRVESKIRRIGMKELESLLGRCGVFPIPVGRAGHEEDFEIYAEDLDGKLTVITGKKESGKSHLSKVLIKTLVQYGAFVIVFDLNNEYGGLGWSRIGVPSSINQQVKILEPGKTLRFTLNYCGKTAISGMLKNALDMPAASLREFLRIWDSCESKQSLSIDAIGNAVNTWNLNELVRDALVSRYHVIRSSRLFVNGDGGLKFEDIISGKSGAAMIINMGEVSPTVRRMVVELVLSKIVDLLEHKQIPPIFLFAEEAHIYIRDTYWEDIITRMRHFGIYTTFITNQPDAISDSIYRQVDNIFLFNFTNDNDLDKISKVSLADNDTIRSIVRTLPQRHCLAIGKAVCDLPVVIKVAAAELVMLGETKKFFTKK
ncbi:MAG: ATP-binding protein [Nitrososphaera sp.]|jgi:AAA+ ATPase superfamily predicted ATPase